MIHTDEAPDRPRRASPPPSDLLAHLRVPDDALTIVVGGDAARVASALAQATSSGKVLVVALKRSLLEMGSAVPGGELEAIRSLLAQGGATSQRWFTYATAPGRPSVLVDHDAWRADASVQGLASLLVARAVGEPGSSVADFWTLVVAAGGRETLARAIGDGVAWTTGLPEARAPWRRTRQLTETSGGWQLRPVDAADAADAATSGPLTISDSATGLTAGVAGEDLLARLLLELGPQAAETQQALRGWAQAASAAMLDGASGTLHFDIQPRNFTVVAGEWRFVDDGHAVRFPYPTSVFVLRAIFWLVTQRALRHPMPGVPLSASVLQVVDQLMGVVGERVTDVLIELWVQFEADLQLRTGASTQPRAQITQQLRDALAAPCLYLMVDTEVRQRLVAERDASDAAAARATAKAEAALAERDELLRQLSIERRQATDSSDRLAQLNARVANPRQVARKRGFGVEATLRRGLSRARRAPGVRVLDRVLPNPLFDADWYRTRYDDVREKGANAYRHYLDHGWHEGRDPNPLFDTSWYLARNPDVGDSGLNPLDHFLHFGAAEGRDPSQFFDTQWYVATYPDVRGSGVNPLLHFLRRGRAEGRLGLPVEDRVRAVALSAADRDGSERAAVRRRSQRSLNRITLFHDGRPERAALENLAPAAEQRGFEVTFSDDFERPAEIGVYCTHGPSPANSHFSVVMLHDVGQEWWPDNQVGDKNHWRYSPWNEFDLGILPGPAWSDTWRRFCDRPSTRPRLGVFELGWPKADRVFADVDDFAGRVRDLRRSLELADRQSVLYALSWETAEKQEIFISALGDLPVNLLIKPQPDAGPSQRHPASNVVVLDPRTDIFECLALADVLVSDESSVMGEALLFEVGSVAVSDWDVPALPGLYPFRDIHTPGETAVPREPLVARKSAPPGFAVKTAAARLRPAVEGALSDSVSGRWRLEMLRERWFSHIGRSSELIVDTIDAAVTGAPWPVEPLKPAVPQ